MSTIFASVLRFLAACIVLPSSANAQRTNDGIRRAWDECSAKTNASPEFLALRHKVGSRRSPELAYSIDKATPQEAQQLQILLRDYMIPCRQFELEMARRRLPPIVPFLLSSYAKSDINFERLIAGQITWGQFIRDADALRAELGAEIGRHESTAVDDGSQSDSPRQ